MKKKLVISTVMALIVSFVSGSLGSQAAGETRNRQSDKKNQIVRTAAVAGTFYPGSPTKLRRTIKRMLDSVPDLKPTGGPVGRIMAAVAPHAGYMYSGRVAAYTHKFLSGIKFDTIVIIGHDAYRDAVAFTCPVDYFETPLGRVPVDREMMTKIQQFDRGIKANRQIHTREHTIEMQLPFLQVQGRDCKIVPILFGNPTLKNCRILADAILAAAGSKSVFVLASADMSHYPGYTAANRIDGATLKVLESLDAAKLLTHLSQQERQPSVPNLRTTMCARGGVGTAILVARALGADRGRILRYANSGDVSGGNKSRVVGYGSVLMVKTGGEEKRK